MALVTTLGTVQADDENETKNDRMNMQQTTGCSKGNSVVEKPADEFRFHRLLRLLQVAPPALNSSSSAKRIRYKRGDFFTVILNNAER